MKQSLRLIIALFVVALALIPLSTSLSLNDGQSIKIEGSDSLEGVTTTSGSTLSATGEIQIAVDKANPGTTIFLWPKTYYDNVNVDKDLMIKGCGKLWTIVDGQQKGPVFSIDPDVTVTLSGMTIQNGHGILQETISTAGGIMNFGTTTIENCIIKNNYAEDSGGGVFNAYDPLLYPDCSLTVKNSQFIENSAFRNGGAIFNQGPLTIINCIFNKNTAALDPNANAFGGGAIANPLGKLTVSNSLFIDNIANSAGAIFNADGATAGINHCTFAGNKAIGYWDPSSGLGGAIFNGHHPGSCTIKNSIITGNTAKINGGGIYWEGAAPTTTGTIIFGNTPNNIGHA
jgi:predicted outer membrane repeat protein